MAQIKPMVLIESMKKKVCMHKLNRNYDANGDLIGG